MSPDNNTNSPISMSVNTTTPLPALEAGIGGDNEETEVNTGEIESASEDESESPKIPLEVYKLLPEVLKKGTEAFISQREKDVFLVSAITLLSGCFPKVSGIYDGKRVHANLFSFIIAPAASGKSALTAGKDLVQPIHNDLLSSSSEIGLTIGVEPSPQRRVLFIPGNISSAAMITMLRDNEGIGIICETEADTISNAIKQEWGGFSDSLRKAFHHEHISYARKQGNQFIEIPKPRLSVLLSGTPNQLHGIIKGIEDGLFSRFIFYKFQNKPRWRDPSPNGSGIIFETYMADIKEDIRQMYEQGQTGSYRFDLSTLHWTKLNAQYARALNKTVTFVGDETASNVFRLGLIHYRIAMVLSILRHFEANSEGTDIICSDSDYSVAEGLCEVFLSHGLVVYEALTKKSLSTSNDNKTSFFNALPIIPFQRKEAVLVGSKLGVAERTVNKYLAQFTERGFLKHEKGGSYEKIPDPQ